MRLQQLRSADRPPAGRRVIRQRRVVCLDENTIDDSDDVELPARIQSRLAKPVTIMAAMLTSLLALEIFFLAGRLAFFSTEGLIRTGLRPISIHSDAAHNAFHIVEDTGYAFTAAALLLFLAWGPIRRGTVIGLLALLTGQLEVDARVVEFVPLGGVCAPIAQRRPAAAARTN